MLKRERYELAVGGVFIASIALLIVGLLWGKRYRPSDSLMTIHVQFPTVGGLSRGDAVLVSGIRLGEVVSLKLRDHDVIVGATLRRDVHLYEGYQVHVSVLSFTGEMGLTIEPGTGAPLPRPYDHLVGIKPFDLADVVDPGLSTLQSVQSISDTLTSLLPGVVMRTNRTLDRLDSVLTLVQGEVMVTRTPLRQSIDQLRITLSHAEELLGTVGTKVDTSLSSADRTFASLHATSDSLRAVVAAIHSTNGTAGKLIHDPALYNDLRAAAAHLDSAATSVDSLASDVRRHPGRYVHISLF